MISLIDNRLCNISKGTSLFLAITFEDAESVKKAYEILQEGSTIIYPMVSITRMMIFVE
ncbi:MAG TPA: hypothetical protein VEG39_13075 [Clostridia bacterium]|nr:hypothetical protein [Clostridia bacterium]